MIPLDKFGKAKQVFDEELEKILHEQDEGVDLSRIKYGRNTLESNRVTFMQALRSSGYSYKQIASVMIAFGQHRRKGQGQWTARSVRQVLSHDPVKVTEKREYTSSEIIELLQILDLDKARGKYS